MGYTELHSACNSGNVEKVRSILDNKLVQNVNEKEDKHGYTPLLFACYNGHTQIVELLLKDQRVDVNVGDKNGKTGLFWACENRKMDIIKMMLQDERVEINKSKNDGLTPLMIVSSHGDIEVLRYLLAFGKGVDLSLKNQNGKDIFAIVREKMFWRSHDPWKRKQEMLKLLQDFHENPEMTGFELKIEFGMRGSISIPISIHFFIFFFLL